jgi:alpha/beta superfamily hydrolase
MTEPISADAPPGNTSSDQERPLFFTSGSHTLYGVLCAPSTGAHEDLVVVFCHSVGIEHMVTQRMEVLGVRAATNAGFVAFRYDSRAHGDSGGDPKDTTFTDLVDDACAAADYARQQSGAARIIWVGIRFGCLIAAEAIARRSDAAALALWEPMHDGIDYFRGAIRTMLFCQVAQGKRSASSVDGLLKRLEADGVLPVVGTYLYRNLSGSVRETNLKRSLQNWGGNTLIAQVQRRPALSATNQDLCSAVEHQGGKVTVALISQEPSWSMLPLVRPQWTSEALLTAMTEWLHGLG